MEDFWSVSKANWYAEREVIKIQTKVLPGSSMANSED